MKKFQAYLHEEDDAVGDSIKSVTNFIASNLNRIINASDEQDLRPMLMLIAALNVLSNADNNPNALQTARRLATVAMARLNRRKSKSNVKETT